jgi:hypothetical protein
MAQLLLLTGLLEMILKSTLNEVALLAETL